MPPRKVQTTLTSFATGATRSAPLVVDEELTKKRSREGGLASTISDEGWRRFLDPLLCSSNFQNIETFLERQYSDGKTIFPQRAHIFAAFNVTPLERVKVVLIGQDPYHDDGQAHGLCFSVLPGVKPPPSLVNMYKELSTDIAGFKTPNHGYLESWAQQGVLMLNATLTVEAHQPNSHAKCGWQEFTDGVIRNLGQERSGLVFLLWGGFAQKKSKLIDASKHKIVACAHPSPLSVKHWLGCKTFSKCNEALRSLGKGEIDWNLPETAPGAAK